MFKRVIIKLSGESLSGNTSGNFDDATIDRISKEIKSVTEKGVQVGLVVGGGNFWRGRSSDSKMDRAKADDIGMLATVINAIYISDHLRQLGMKTAIMTPFIIGTMTEQFSKDKAEKLLNENTILIFAGGSGLPFFSTDTITTVRAAELQVDAILFAKNNVNGIYNADPRKNPNAEKYDKITYREIIKQNLQAIDISAIAICEQQGVNSVVFGLDEPNSIVLACTGDEAEILSIGTKVTN